MDKELKRYRTQPFLEESFEGIRKFDKELVEFLKSSGSHTEEDILIHLNIDFSESDLVKAVNRQLQILEDYGW